MKEQAENCGAVNALEESNWKNYEIILPWLVRKANLPLSSIAQW